MPVCEGFGKTLDISEELVVPNPRLSLFEGAVVAWRGPSSRKWQDAFVHAAGERFPVHTPYEKLSEAERRLLWEGDGDRVKGLDAFFDHIASKRAAVEYRTFLARFRGKTTCRTCHGTRLRPEASYVRVGGATITELVSMPVDRLLEWFRALDLDETDTRIASRLLTEITRRLSF